MIYKIIWFNEAVEDLEKIYNFYFDVSVHTADKIYHSILNAIDSYLTSTPEIAAIEPLIEGGKETFRSLIVFEGLFKVVFYISGNSVIITQVWCCRQNPKDMRRF